MPCGLTRFRYSGQSHFESAPITSAVRRAFHVRVVGLPGLAPLQAAESAHREDEGEDRSHAERDECPDEEDSAGLGDPRPLSCG
jgi:hypothetical protein